MSRIIFLSSVQRKFDKEREAIWDYVRGDALLGKHFEVFLFENNRSKAEVQ
jgi:ATP-dependent DNA helicase RecG